jgi:hypothetical protein
MPSYLQIQRRGAVAVSLFFLVCSLFCQFTFASNCEGYLKKDEFGHAVGVTRVESLRGWQTEIHDLSDQLIETRSHSDPKLRVVNLANAFEEGRPFLGFGLPNVYLAMPGQTEHGLGFAKFAAKSFWRPGTHVEKTYDRVQSGLLVVFSNLDQKVSDELYRIAKTYEGKRFRSCVRANCQVLADAGFTIGGESLRSYVLPDTLLKDIRLYGLEYQGRSVALDFIKTKPGYLEDINLSIQQAVYTTICRHGERACAPLLKKLEKNSFVVQVNEGLKHSLGLAILPEPPKPIVKPKWESQHTRIIVPPELERNYELHVSEPSMLAFYLRLLWGPHSLFEIPIDRTIVDELLPNKLTAFPPKEKSSLMREFKKRVLFPAPTVRLMRSQLSESYNIIPGLNQTQLLDMLRTDSEEYPNRYNFIVLGNRIIIMKLDIHNGMVDWVLAKHVLLSNYSEDVRFAGEIWKTADGVIHINNNSGSYEPETEWLANILELFNRLFPGVPCVVEAPQL